MKTHDRKPNRYMNPYLGGVGVGMALLLSFLILGAGLGASSGLARCAAWTEMRAFRTHVLTSEYFGQWGENPLGYYLVFMLLGTFLGGVVSAVQAQRIQIGVERGRTCSPLRRLLYALFGGILVGFASRLASGCTSGQALTGTAMLLTGSIIFLVCIFVGGYATAWLVRRQWDD